MKSRVLLPVLLSASAAWAGSGEDKVLRELGPDKKLGMCGFRLRGIVRENFVGAGLVAGIVEASSDGPRGINRGAYSQQMTAEFLHIYEEALRKAGAFQFSPSDGIVAVKNGKALTASQAAQENDLFACVTAEARLGVGFGMKKKVSVETAWQITQSSGAEVEIETDATPDETQGVFPDMVDPALKPVLLRLARENARQFLQELGKQLKDAGSRAEVTIVDLDEVPVATLLDPGTLPQPEPECALNSNGKWEKRVALGDGADLALVYIPDGRFVMGSLAARDDEGSHPQHEVTIGRAFWIGKLEVTQAQWKAVMGTNPSIFKGDDRPVDSVSWNDAVAFLVALNRRLGRDQDGALRLPTEAEWEYACRAGTTSNYSFSDAEWNLAQHAWFESNSAKGTHPVGRLHPNPWGAFDMYGNVAEWCQDAWHESYEGAPTDGRAWRGEDRDRVLRGGHWDTAPPEARSYYRYGEEAKKGTKTAGFRLVMPALHAQTVLPNPADAAVATPETVAPTPAAAAVATPQTVAPTPAPRKLEGGAAVSSTSASASTEAPAPVVDENVAQPGMTFQQVEEKIGRPAWRAGSGKFARWAYGRFSVLFENGRVVRISYP